MSINIRDAKPSKDLALDDSNNSESRTRFSDIAPRDSQVRLVVAGFVSPTLGSSIRPRIADDSAVLSLSITLDDEVVVATFFVFIAVASEVLDGRGLALEGSGVRVGGVIRTLVSMTSGGGSRVRSAAGGNGMRGMNRSAQLGVSRAAATRHMGDRSLGRREVCLGLGRVWLGGGGWVAFALVARSRNMMHRSQGLGGWLLCLGRVTSRARSRMFRVAATRNKSDGRDRNTAVPAEV